MGSVGGSWRLKYVILLFVMLISMYVMNGMFYEQETTIEGYIVEDTEINFNDTEQATEEAGDFWGFLYGIGDFLTFGNIENSYARILINILVAVCWIIIGYILYTLITQHIPFT